MKLIQLFHLFLLCAAEYKSHSRGGGGGGDGGGGRGGGGGGGGVKC